MVPGVYSRLTLGFLFFRCVGASSMIGQLTPLDNGERRRALLTQYIRLNLFECLEGPQHDTILPYDCSVLCSQLASSLYAKLILPKLTWNYRV